MGTKSARAFRLDPAFIERELSLIRDTCGVLIDSLEDDELWEDDAAAKFSKMRFVAHVGAMSAQLDTIRREES